MSGIKIFQIHYRAQQTAMLDPAFVPYNNAGDLDPLLEFNVFRKLWRGAETAGLDYWGALSWKFSQKSGLSGQALLETIEANPGYDAYFCNPHPETEALFHNLWFQGETSHPYFRRLVREVFIAAGLDETSIDEFWPARLFASTNYFVARPAFWAEYIPFVEHVVASARDNLSKAGRAMLMSSMADAKGAHADASYMPFIIERLFSTFLQHSAGRFRTYKYATAKSALENSVHLRHLRDMKDRATEERSEWLADCWASYRKLYLTQMHGMPWMRSYYPLLRPRERRFVQAVPDITCQVAQP